ncbi:sensor histidine kinase, partial [Moraxella catarrhalis]|uniref:sensor histidine kinase n=1 Tax=Moraxella catarrhalis TaxID=480 RepID=UPI0012C0C355
SKIETGQFELHPEALDPTAVLVGVASLLEPAASAKGLKMTAVAAPDVGLVRADPLRLRQALYNIMGNAVKFTPQGSIEARLARDVDENGAQRLRFEVQDTGIGVSEDFRATLFERFEQADSSSTRKYGGSGLGLAIT